MSDDYQYIDVNDEQWDGTPRALREALDKAQKALKAEKQATADLRSQAAASALSGVLTGFKNPERVKRDLLSDKVDPLDEAAVTKWLEANGDDYAKGQANPEPPSEAQQQEQQLQEQYEGLQLGGDYTPAADLQKLDLLKANTADAPDGAAVAAEAARLGI